MLNNNNQWNRIGSWLSFCVMAVLLSACSEVSDSLSDGTSLYVSSKDAIALTGSVVASKQATRANETIVNLGERTLPATTTTGFYAGLFGCYTGQHTWGGLITLSAAMTDNISAEEFTVLHGMAEYSSYANKEALQTAAPAILKENYTANMFYNTKATIGDDGTLSYEPLRFWPNSLLTGDASQHEYCTFWAYYPYNPTAEIGDYGITLIPENVGEGTGMGRVKFTMQPDAAEQNDFMISWPAVDCNRDGYPLIEDPQGTYSPKPVPLRFYHMLAQVRIYAYIRGSDRMVYIDANDDGVPDPATAADLATAERKYFRKADSTNDGVATGMWLEKDSKINGVTIDQTYIDEHGIEKPAVMDQYGTWIELKEGDKVPDESKCQRWSRTDTWDLKHTRRRADISYQMEFNNIKTTTTFYPDYSSGSASIAYEPATTLGSATVNNYIMNPYWFHFNANNERDYLDDEFMFGKFESTWASTENKLSYMLDDNNKDAEGKHYNYAPGNTLLVVPQKLDDDDVPHIVLTAKGNDAKYTARLTINMLKMGIEWKSGFIYCYAILDDLRPGDDIVRGPESITTIFDTEQYTDQW